MLYGSCRVYTELETPCLALYQRNRKEMPSSIVIHWTAQLQQTDSNSVLMSRKLLCTLGSIALEQNNELMD